jgi:hypothetical protein
MTENARDENLQQLLSPASCTGPNQLESGERTAPGVCDHPGAISLQDSARVSIDGGAAKANGNFQPQSETFAAAIAELLARPDDERRRIAAALRSSLRRAVRPDYRRQIAISAEEASDLTGYAKKTIQNALASGRVKRCGVGRYCNDQASVIRAYSKGKK